MCLFMLEGRGDIFAFMNLYLLRLRFFTCLPRSMLTFRLDAVSFKRKESSDQLNSAIKCTICIVSNSNSTLIIFGKIFYGMMALF